MKDQICQHHKYGYCKFQSQCQKRHVEGHCEALGACQQKTSCNKRHPKACKRFTLEKFCKFGLDCDYAHLNSDNSNLEATVVSHIANMKAEIIELKYALQRIAPNDLVAGELENLKEDIKKLKTENAEIVSKIMILQKELESDTEDEDIAEKTSTTELFGLLLCNYCSYQCRSKEKYQNHIKSHKKKECAEVFKCDKCNFNCDTTNTFRKHMNTRHPSSNNLKKSTSTDCIQINDRKSESHEDLSICPNCLKEFNTRIILRDHFQKTHVDKEPDLYHQNLDKLLDMYEANLEDSDNDDKDSNNVK